MGVVVLGFKVVADLGNSRTDMALLKHLLADSADLPRASLPEGVLVIVVT